MFFIPKTLSQLSCTLLIALLVYRAKHVYFPQVTLKQVHECLYHVDESHCGKLENWI